MSSSHLEKIETLLLSKTAAQEPEFKMALGRLSVEIGDRIKTGSPSSVDFFFAVLRALARIRGSAHADVRMTCLNDSAWFLYAQGHSSEALAGVELLERLANQTKDKAWIRRAENLGGMVEADLGNVAGAVIRYSNALTLAIELKDIVGELAVLGNLGTALNYGGLYREAIPCFERVSSLLRIDSVAEAVSHATPHAREMAPAAFTNLAQSYHSLEQFEKGFAAISHSLAISREPADATTAGNRVIREFTFVQLALALGKVDQARTHSQLCDLYAVKAGRRGQHLSDIARGLCEVYGGDVSAGLALLESVLSSSGDGNVFRTNALTALVRAYEQANRPERALECMHELLEHIKSAREKGILALVSLPAKTDSISQLLPDSDDLRALKCKEAQLRAKVAENDAVNSRIEMLERLAVAADLREEASGEHGYRVGKLSSLVAEQLDWSRDACFSFDLAARLHDIGKIGMPDRILLNSAQLKDAERHFMATHTVIGAELLGKSNIPQLRMAEAIARSHHEWWNGAGYPNKLAGKRIPVHARIVAICDVFDALTHGRPYAEPWPIDKALEEIRIRRGTQFDPELTDLFLTVVKRLRDEHVDLDAYLGKASQDSPFLQARHKIKLMLTREREEVAKAADLEAETVA